MYPVRSVRAGEFGFCWAFYNGVNRASIGDSKGQCTTHSGSHAVRLQQKAESWPLWVGLLRRGEEFSGDSTKDLQGAAKDHP